jgi:hypothetical protein
LGVGRWALEFGEHARLGRWFQRLAETSLRNRDSFANGRDARAPRNSGAAAALECRMLLTLKWCFRGRNIRGPVDLPCPDRTF